MTRYKKTLFSILLLLPVVLYIVSNLKNDSIVIQAKYLMLACERCFHMEIINAHDAGDISKIIIPESSVYNIEALISTSVKEKHDLCIEGSLYTLNLSNIWRIDPPGAQFEVVKSHPLSRCQSLERHEAFN